MRAYCGLGAAESNRVISPDDRYSDTLLSYLTLQLRSIQFEDLSSGLTRLHESGSHNLRSKTSMENGASTTSSDPSSFLSEIIGAPVKVKLNSSVEYRG